CRRSSWSAKDMAHLIMDNGQHCTHVAGYLPKHWQYSKLTTANLTRADIIGRFQADSGRPTAIMQGESCASKPYSGCGTFSATANFVGSRLTSLIRWRRAETRWS